MENFRDPILKSILTELVEKHGCHTVILYGSRARGLVTATSDYDVFGVRTRGRKIRIAKKQKGFFWDVFVYSEKDLKKLSHEPFIWKNDQVLFQKGQYGTALVRRIDRLVKKPFQARPQFEIKVLKVWAQKQIERCRVGDIQGFFRRAEFLTALVEHYFFIRQKRFLGPKEGLVWIENHDPKVFKLIQRALKHPGQLSYLKAAAQGVYRVSLN